MLRICGLKLTQGAYVYLRKLKIATTMFPDVSKFNDTVAIYNIVRNELKTVSSLRYFHKVRFYRRKYEDKDA